MERGVIITTPWEYEESTLRVGWFDPAALRQYLLYWDKIDWPDNNVVSFRTDHPDIAFLESAGIMSRTHVDVKELFSDVGKALIRAQHVAFSTRNRDEPGAWSLAQQSSYLAAPEEDTTPTRFIEVELYSAIPIPGGEVAFEDILNFKLRRRDELRRFRSGMDDLSQQVSASDDLPRARIQALDKVDQALQDLHRVFDETFTDRLISSVKVELNVPALAGAAALVGVASTSFGLPIAAGAALGAIAAAVKFDLRLGRKSIDVPTTLRDYAYLHSIHREFG